MFHGPKPYCKAVLRFSHTAVRQSVAQETFQLDNEILQLRWSYETTDLLVIESEGE